MLRERNIVFPFLILFTTVNSSILTFLTRGKRHWLPLIALKESFATLSEPLARLINCLKLTPKDWQPHSRHDPSPHRIHSRYILHVWCGVSYSQPKWLCHHLAWYDETLFCLWPDSKRKNRKSNGKFIIRGVYFEKVFCISHDRNRFVKRMSK